jgi:DNA transposition AAA+ family ATPase
MTTNSFAEDHLPEGQPVIETKNVRRCRSFMRLITDPRRRSPTMGVITGLAGVGKTIATQYYLDSLAPHAQTALPTAIKVKVMPRSTPRALAKTILDSLLEKSRGSNIYEIADEAAEAIERNYISLLVVDEADRLNEDSFEVLRHLFDKTGCRIVLVGLPNILSVIERHQKFSSRVGLRMPFVPLELKEVLEVILPQLVFPCWNYNPELPSDRQLGETIWHKVNPSLRNLTTLLATASQMATDEQFPSITSDLIDEAYVWMMTQQEQYYADVPKPPTETEAKGAHERASEERHKAKEKTNKP